MDGIIGGEVTPYSGNDIEWRRTSSFSNKIATSLPGGRDFFLGLLGDP